MVIQGSNERKNILYLYNELFPSLISYTSVVVYFTMQYILYLSKVDENAVHKYEKCMSQCLDYIIFLIIGVVNKPSAEKPGVSKGASGVSAERQRVREVTDVQRPGGHGVVVPWPSHRTCGARVTCSPAAPAEQAGEY